jgi:lipoprotein-anchoring transpeptidase ErfK/SrfK
VRRAVAAGGVVVVVLVGSLALARRAPEEATATAAATVAPPSSETTTTTAPPTTEAPTTTEPPPVAADHADPPRFPTSVAVASGKSTPIYASPGGPVKQTLTSPRPYSRMPQVFTVILPADASTGWLPVNLPTRPNGSTGWVRTADVDIDSHAWSIDINLSARWATVYKGGDVFVATPVIIGLPSSPTPVGDSYIVEGVWTTSPGGAYGPFIYGLSSHSDVYTEFAGGDGQIGLHGTNQPGLLGTAASHGCVRFPNDVIRSLANTLPMGVPVHIHD